MIKNGRSNDRSSPPVQPSGGQKWQLHILLKLADEMTDPLARSTLLPW